MKTKSFWPKLHHPLNKNYCIRQASVKMLLSWHISSSQFFHRPDRTLGEPLIVIWYLTPQSRQNNWKTSSVNNNKRWLRITDGWDQALGYFWAASSKQTQKATFGWKINPYITRCIVLASQRLKALNLLFSNFLYLCQLWTYQTMLCFMLPLSNL